MYQGRIVFSQIMDHLPGRHFKACVNRYHGDHRIRTFTCLDQFYCMSFAQLSPGLTKGTISRKMEGARVGWLICGEAVQKLYRSFYI